MSPPKQKNLKKKKKILNYLRRKKGFDELLTPKEKERALSLWYKEKYKYANGEIRKSKC